MRECLRSVIVVLVVTGAAAPAAAQSARAEQVASGYQLLYAGDERGAIRHFQSLLGTSPDDLAYRFGLLTAERERLDNDVPLRADFERRLDGIIALADKRYGRTTQDAEALFYLAQAYLMRARYRVDYDKGMWGAARDGVKAKNYSEAYVKVHPEHGDAYLPLGLYNYYVELAPAFFKVLRFMLFLPAGNRAEGLKQIERAASQGSLFGPQAQELLVEIYAQLEGRTADAVAAGELLQQRYPSNDDFAFTMAEVYASAGVEDHGRAAEVYERIADRRKKDETPDAAEMHYRALLNLAEARVSQWRIDQAIGVLTPVIDARVATPAWVLPHFLLRRSNYRALTNDPAAADDARRVLSDPAMASHKAAAEGLLKWIEPRNVSGDAATYAALIPANRLAYEGKWDEARRLYEGLAARNPQSPLIRYWLAHLDFASGHAERALAPFMTLANGGRSVPENLRASALLHVARTHDLAGRRDVAKRFYQQIVDSYESQRAAGAARVGLVTPYKRPAPRK
jgi:hypothetical protein